MKEGKPPYKLIPRRPQTDNSPNSFVEQPTHENGAQSRRLVNNPVFDGIGGWYWMLRGRYWHMG